MPLKTLLKHRTNPKKHCFTLLEIMVCLSILAVVAGAMVFPLSGMLARHRFNQGVKQFVIHVRELQALALNHQSDMGIALEHEQNKWTCKGFTDEPMKLFKPFELKNLSAVTFDKKPAKMPLKIQILASGRVIPPGTLAFTYDEELIEIDFTSSPLIKVKQGKVLAKDGDS